MTCLGRHAQRGQAAIEMSVASAFLLVPLLLMTPLVGKYADMAMATRQAVHYVAFQRTILAEPAFVGLGDNQRGATMKELSNGGLRNGAASRFFGGNTDTINNTQQSGLVNDLLLYENRPLWTDHAGNELVPDLGNTSLSMNEALLSPDLGSSALATTMGTVNALTLGSAGFNLNYSWYYTASLTMTPGNPVGPEPFDSLGLSFNASATILGDGWSASDPGYNTQQVNGVTLTASLQSITDTLGVAEAAMPIPLIVASVIPDIVGLELGRVLEDNPCEVPPDRTSGVLASCIPLPDFVPLP